MDPFPQMLNHVRERFARFAGQPLFQTAASNLFQVFLKNLPPENQQHYNCNCCKHFFKHFAGLVSIDPVTGATIPVMWGPANKTPPFFADAESDLYKTIIAARVTSVFKTDRETMGYPTTDGWSHFAVDTPSVLKDPKPVTTIAMLNERRRMIENVVSAYTAVDVSRAADLFRSGELPKADLYLEMTRWLLTMIESTNPNKAWLAAVKVPEAFAHVGSSMVGTLLKDLKAGLPLSAIKARFEDKVDPTKFHHSTAPIKAGTVAAAERMLTELQSKNALSRRFATIADLAPIWKQSPVMASARDVLKPLRLTWAKFAREYMPDALKIDVLIPDGKIPMAAMVAPGDPHAPQILQTPLSWYTYPGGSPAPGWNLTPGSFKNVPAITVLPSLREQGIFVCIEGAGDKGYVRGGAFFPEDLLSQYRPVRAALEAVAMETVIQGSAMDAACGLILPRDGGWGLTLRLTMAKTQIYVVIDRWD